MEMKHKSFPASLKAAGDDGVIEAIVSVFGNVDSYNERVRQWFFASSLAKGMPKCVWMHDWSKPIAKTIDAKELAPGDPMLPAELSLLGGLYVKWQFHKEIADSWQAYLKIKEGYIDEYSIGYKLTKWETDEKTGIMDLLDCDLYEAGPVLVGANRATTTLSVKQDLMDGPVGMSIEEHTTLLLDRIEKRFEAREAAETLTDGFINRLSETGEKILALVSKAKARDAAATTGNDKCALEWEALKHAQRMRDIRIGVQS
jgi:HK97 family phage prohead protease